MEYDPHLLIEGMTIAGYAIGAKLGFIYIRGEFAWIADILERAIAAGARARACSARTSWARGFDFDIVVHLGAGAYVCGEETALIESLEGKRGNPRLKPPFPAVVGLYGCPTIVNNVETLACVPYIVEHGAAAFMQFGTANNFGPKIFGISGHVQPAGRLRVPPRARRSRPCSRRPAASTGELKAVIVGGLSVPILTAAEAAGLRHGLRLLPEAGAPCSAPAGIMVMNETHEHPARSRCAPSASTPTSRAASARPAARARTPSRSCSSASSPAAARRADIDLVL